VYLCTWCDVCFRYRFELLEHSRGATRSTSAGKPICLLDPLVIKSIISIDDKSLRNSPSSDQAATEIPDGEHGLDEKTDNAGLLNSHHCRTIGEEDEENNARPGTETNATVTLQAEGGQLKTLTGIAIPLPPAPAPASPPANVNRQMELRAPNDTESYGMVDRNPMQASLGPSNSRTSAYDLSRQLDTNVSIRSYTTTRRSSSAAYTTARTGSSATYTTARTGSSASYTTARTGSSASYTAVRTASGLPVRTPPDEVDGPFTG
jgi:hypothetical protein